MLDICSFVAVSQDANSQEDTAPAPEAASATVEDVGGGLVGDFVARCWITMGHLVTEEVCFVNTFGRVYWLPLATPVRQDFHLPRGHYYDTRVRWLTLSWR